MGNADIVCIEGTMSGGGTEVEQTTHCCGARPWRFCVVGGCVTARLVLETGCDMRW